MQQTQKIYRERQKNNVRENQTTLVGKKKEQQLNVAKHKAKQ